MSASASGAGETFWMELRTTTATQGAASLAHPLAAREGSTDSTVTAKAPAAAAVPSR